MTSAGVKLEKPVAELRFTDESHAVQAAVAGQGIAMLSLELVKAEFGAGQLVAPFAQTIPGHAYHLVCLGRRSPDAGIATVIDWLRKEVSAAGR